MTNPTDGMKPTVQETLDELFNEHLIPFRLTAQNVNAVGSNRFSVPFYDSRLRSVDFVWYGGQPFKEVVRTAVLDRVKRLSGPLKGFGLA